MQTSSGGSKVLRLGVVGLGLRSAGMVRVICGADPAVQVAAIADPNPSACARAQSAGAAIPGLEQARIYENVGALLAESDDLDGFVVGTPCNLHAPVAAQLAVRRLPLFLEKPVAVNWEQLDQLGRAWQGMEDRVVVSFPLRLSPLLAKALEIIQSGRLGTINQIQAINNVPYGGVYYGQWYRDYAKTGGLWLQKATHDFDYLNVLAGAEPTHLTAMHGRRIYGGDLPADLVCSQCDRTVDCMESPRNLVIRGEDGGTLLGKKVSADADHACLFSRSIKHQDCGSAMILYANGIHACYTQNFVSRRSAATRGATIVGYKATLRFDWYTDRITLISHHTDQVEQIDVKPTSTHSGGDQALAESFIAVLRGREQSRANLRAGLLSVAMCLTARKAAGGAGHLPIQLPHPGEQPMPVDLSEVEPITG